MLGAGCKSTALSLGNPNEVNATFNPEFIAADKTEQDVFVSAPGMDTWNEGAVVVASDLGQGLYLSSWEFESEDPGFKPYITLRRTTDAPKGLRSLSLQIRNAFGTFLLRGEFTVL